MTDEIVGTIFVDDRLDSYKNFFDDDWAQRIIKLSHSAPILEGAVIDLIIGWRATSYTSALPAEILNHISAFYDGHMRAEASNSLLLRMSEAIRDKLAREMPELQSNPLLLRNIQSKLVDICARTRDAHEQSWPEFPLERSWQSYLETIAYQLTLWGSQRTCYIAIYTGYESFLVQCVKHACGLERCRTMDKDFNEHLKNTFGEDIRDKCWTNTEINIAQSVRTALVHAGGHVTEDLAKKQHRPKVLNDRIQVIPADTKQLFDHLKEAAYALTEKAMTLSAFAPT